MPFSTLTNQAGGTNLVQMDQARAKALRTRAQAGGNGLVQGGSMFSPQASQSSGVSYVVPVLIGDPPTQYSLLIDTGSSNTWVGAGRNFTITDTTVVTGEVVSVTYGSGYFSGFEVLDKLTLASGLTIENQSIGVAEMCSGFDGVDGILGVGPQDLTCGTQLPNATACVPTVIDNAWAEGLLKSDELGIAFSPAGRSAYSRNGEITFGGIDSSKYTGSIDYTPLTNTTPANMFVGIDQSVSYGNTKILSTTAGIVDTGTTLLLLATDAFNVYQNTTGAVLDEATGLLTITQEQYNKLESLYFDIGNVTYELVPDAQLWPRTLNEDIGGEKGAYYLIVSDSGTKSGSGLDFINGMTWLERFYAVYDAGNGRVGFATTRHTREQSNGLR
ncbi:aspartic peptidase A1 [Amylocystis lapponica]|nr:aspartic peptidase A1 [Amylocystis lapponica]